jgi:hypothetical protein
VIGQGDKLLLYRISLFCSFSHVTLLTRKVDASKNGSHIDLTESSPHSWECFFYFPLPKFKYECSENCAVYFQVVIYIICMLCFQIYLT